MGLDFANKVKVVEIKDIEELICNFDEIKKFMNLNQNEMDAWLQRFGEM
jgi:hypothetical protein